MSRWVLDFLKLKEDSIDSLKDELVPLLVSKQYTKIRSRFGASYGGNSFRGDDSLDESQMSTLLDSMLSEISCHIYIHSGVCSRAMNLPSFVRLNDAALSGDFAAACGGTPGTALNTGLHWYDAPRAPIFFVPLSFFFPTSFNCIQTISLLRCSVMFLMRLPISILALQQGWKSRLERTPHLDGQRQAQPQEREEVRRW
jgi:hypothetical protein